MENYNPRQITQMRYKDVKTLEHLIFKANDINLSHSGNVVIQLQNGSVSPMKSVSDIVTEA